MGAQLGGSGLESRYSALELGDRCCFYLRGLDPDLPADNGRLEFRIAISTKVFYGGFDMSLSFGGWWCQILFLGGKATTVGDHGVVVFWIFTASAVSHTVTHAAYGHTNLRRLNRALDSYESFSPVDYKDTTADVHMRRRLGVLTARRLQISVIRPCLCSDAFTLISVINLRGGTTTRIIPKRHF